jgi:hypothetical protein
MLATFVLGSDGSAVDKKGSLMRPGYQKDEREDLLDHSIAALCLSVVFATLYLAAEHELAL